MVAIEKSPSARRPWISSEKSQPLCQQSMEMTGVRTSSTGQRPQCDLAEYSGERVCEQVPHAGLREWLVSVSGAADAYPDERSWARFTGDLEGTVLTTDTERMWLQRLDVCKQFRGCREPFTDQTMRRECPMAFHFELLPTRLGT